MWGTTRAYLHNHIIGVSEGHSTILRMVGVGYRATIESSATTKSAEYEGQKFVSLKVGYSHPIEMGVPKGVTASTPQPTRILLEGPEKEVVNQFAAKIRKWRVPEPYKGKVSLDGGSINLQVEVLTACRVFSSITRRLSSRQRRSNERCSSMWRYRSYRESSIVGAFVYIQLFAMHTSMPSHQAHS